MSRFNKKELPGADSAVDRHLRPAINSQAEDVIADSTETKPPVTGADASASHGNDTANSPENGKKSPGPILGADTDAAATKLGNDTTATQSQASRPKRTAIAPDPRGEIEPLELAEIHPGLRTRLQDLFVASEDFERHRTAGFNRTEGRVFIIFGPKHSGKFTTAVALGVELRRGEIEEPRLRSYLRRADDRLSLLGLARRNDIERGTVCILRDAFNRNVALDSLRSPWLDALNSTLDDKGAYLILTTDLPGEHLEVNVEKIAAALSSRCIDSVFDKHARRYEELERVQVRGELIGTARDQWRRLKPVLQQPAQIDRFFHRLGELPGDITPEAMEGVARQVASLGRESALPWFNRLRINEKLLALLIGIFPGLRMSRLESIYARAVTALRDDGLTRLRDHREIGFEDLLERAAAIPTHASLLDDPAINFRDDSYSEEVTRQVRSHHDLLWSLAPLFVELSEEAQEPAFSPLRRHLGTALAKAGWGHRSKLGELIEQLARDPSVRIVAVGGFALAASYRLDRKSAVFLDTLLAKWIRSGDRDLMWAVGMIAWQIGEALAPLEAGNDPGDRESATFLRNCLTERLRDLAANAANFSLETIAAAAAEGTRDASWIATAALDNLKCVCTALVEMTIDSPAQTTSVIAAWLSPSSGSYDVRWTAQCAARALFETTTREESSLLPSDLLPLIEPLLDVDDDEGGVIPYMLHALHDSLASPSEASVVTAHLVRLADYCNDRVAANLTAGLAREWLTSESQEACRLGHFLIARCAAMHGAAVFPEGLHRGLVAAEAAEGRRSWFARAVHSVLDARLDASLIWLGSQIVEPRPDAPVKRQKRIGPQGGRPLLLQPALEAAGLRPEIAILLNSRRILDLADSEAERWIAHLHRIVLGDTWDPRSGVPALVVGSRSQCDVLTAIAALVDAAGARKLANLDNAAWRKALAARLGAAPEDFSAAWTQLELSADKLDDVPTTAVVEEDVAPRALATILWLATEDLLATVEHLDAWLASASLTGRRALALSAARLVFRVWRYREAPPVGVHRELLGLAAPIVDNGWEATVLILEALRAWVQEPGWAQALAGDWDQEGAPMGWVQTLISRYPQQLQAMLQRWRGVHEVNRQGAQRSVHEDPTSPETRLASRLALRLALASSGAMPDLAPGLSYVVVILDSVAPDRDSLDAIETVGAGLTKGWRQNAAQRRDLPALLVHRLGRRIPLALPGDDLKAPAQQRIPGPRPPRLLSPIFEAIPVERVERVLLVLTGGPVIDGADWVATSWWDRLQAFSLVNIMVPVEFADQLRSVSGNPVDEILAAALAAPGA